MVFYSTSDGGTAVNARSLFSLGQVRVFAGDREGRFSAKFGFVAVV